MLTFDLLTAEMGRLFLELEPLNLRANVHFHMCSICHNPPQYSITLRISTMLSKPAFITFSMSLSSLFLATNYNPLDNVSVTATVLYGEDDASIFFSFQMSLLIPAGKLAPSTLVSVLTSLSIMQLIYQTYQGL